MSGHPGKVSAVIPAAGSGSRMGSTPLPKQFLEIGGKPVIDWTIEAMGRAPGVDEIILVVPGEAVDQMKDGYLANPSFPKVQAVIAGGKTRTASVVNGVGASSGEWILIHDAVRPFVSARLIERTMEAATKHMAAAPAIEISDTVKHKDGAFLGDSVDRDSLLLVQTPQIFSKQLLLAAYEKLVGKNENWTDETSLLMAAGRKVAWVKGERTNMKITTPEDLVLAQAVASIAL